LHSRRSCGIMDTMAQSGDVANAAQGWIATDDIQD
jgi:hypothetical protein